jgi:sec-independent protein translocase protein TatC
MDDLDSPIDRARAAISDRADLPGMSLMEHLEELRKRLMNSALFLALGFAIAYAFHGKLYGIVRAPLDQLHIALNFTHPTDGLNLVLKTALVGGAILAGPFILYQIWLFISPGMYANEKRYVIPFMGATVGLFLSGVYFGYRWVMPGAIKVLVFDFGKSMGVNPILTIEDYTGFFMSVILGLGICFELPILIFFLALFGIVDARFLLKHFRYAILGIFVVAAIICPMQDPLSMCLFASPMLVLYFLGVGIAYFVHPDHRKAKQAPAA